MLIRVVKVISFKPVIVLPWPTDHGTVTSKVRAAMWKFLYVSTSGWRTIT